MRARVLVLLVAALAPPQETGRHLLVRAEQLLTREAYDPALRLLSEAVALEERTEKTDLTARALHLAGNALIGRGDTEGANTQHSRALDLARSLGDHALEASILADIGQGHYQRAEYAEAERHLRQALALRVAAGDRQGEAATRVALGRIPYKQGRYEEAFAIFQGALAVQEQIGDTKGQAETLLAIAVLRSEMRSFAEALALASRSLALQETLNSPEGRIQVLCAIAAMYLFQDAPDEALERLEGALALADAEKDRSLRAKVLHHLGGAFREESRHHEALAAYDEAFVVMEEDGNLREAAWVLVRRARSLEALGRLAEAEASYHKALALWESMKERRPIGYYLYALGRLQERRGDDEAAMRSYRRALDEQEAVHLPYTSMVLSDMALLFQRRGDAVEGLALARRAVKAADETGNPEMQWSALYGMGRLLRRTGGNEAALSALTESLAIIESMRHDVAPSDEARTGFMETKQDVYADTVSLLFDLGRVEEALEVAERARARAFLDLLATRPTTGNRKGTERPPVAPARLVDIKSEASRRGATFVAYFAGEGDLFTWVASPSGTIHGVRTPLGRVELDRLVERLGAALERGPFFGPSRGTPPGDEAPSATDLDPLLRRLHGALIAPVERWLPPDPRGEITIVPHGPLFRVSFGGLLDRDGRYVAERHTVSYTPAIGVLHYTGSREARAREKDGARLLAVGGPSARANGENRRELPDLPEAAEEMRRIAALWPAGRSTVLTGESARESAVRELAPRFTFLHLASHGVVLDESPLKSFVALTRGAGGGPEDDGALTVSEVFDLDLRADLVTLSACDTGLGKITGDGVLGLSRAFVYAGASSVVVSLWRVADVVGRFQMERFYQALAAGEDKSSSLRRAQLDTLAALRRGDIRTPEGRVLRDSPALWAPFVLVGEPR